MYRVTSEYLRDGYVDVGHGCFSSKLKDRVQTAKGGSSRIVLVVFRGRSRFLDGANIFLIVFEFHERFQLLFLLLSLYSDVAS